MDKKNNNFSILFKALEYASVKHENQRRKGIKKRPYINHPLKVASVLSRVGHENDLDLLVAALLHDVVEDTNTEPGEIEDLFGTKVREIVMEVTDDMSLSQEKRKKLQVENAPFLSDEAKKIKISDKTCNILDLIDYPILWTKRRKYDYVLWCEKVVAGCEGVNQQLESHFQEAVIAAKKKFPITMKYK
ncbi:MAG: HD domain-containing protein [Bacteroidota bacterium]